MAAGATESASSPLHMVEVKPIAMLNRVHCATYTCAIICLVYHRLQHLLHSTDILSFTLYLTMLIAELIFTFIWALTQAFMLRPVRRQTFPDRLIRKFGKKDFPAIDVFVCTADPFKEPPISVINTALSAMAFDYPAEKISVYVSDDGGSELTLFAFMEAARFAKHWLPFCKEHGIQARCPQAYFNGPNISCPSKKWEKMKIMYARMEEKIDIVMNRGHVTENEITNQEECKAFKKWTPQFTRRQHPTVIQVLLDGHNDVDVSGQQLPRLVYVSREKSIITHHNFKAGALNVLLRVSEVMSNGPVILPLDCDMYADDPQAPLRALCFLLDPVVNGDLAFVQFPQRFHVVSKGDIYDIDSRRDMLTFTAGMDGLRGPLFMGTCTFFFRKVFFSGGPSLELSNSSNDCSLVNSSIQLEVVLREAHRVAGCTYEQGSNWGSKVGFRYGTLTEDFFTGYCLHRLGWRSVLCNPSKPSFLGNGPVNLNDILSQRKRWCVGTLEIGISRNCPLTLGTSWIEMLMGMCYAHYAFWAIPAIPLTIYAFLPHLTLINGISLFPKVTDPWFYLYAFLFVGSYGQDLIAYLMDGGTIWKWWNYQRLYMFKGVSSGMFAIIQLSLKLIGIPAPEFNVTSKVIDDDQRRRYEQEKFEFGVKSPFFVCLSTIAIVSLVSFTRGLERVVRQEGNLDEMFAQLFISCFVAVNCWPIYEAMVFRRDRGKMPTTTTLISISIACILYLVASFSLKR